MARIGWAVTGAGCLLEETFEVVERLAKKHEISCFLSSAAEPIVRMYGLWPRLEKICAGGRYRVLVREKVVGADSPLMGRFTMGLYAALVVSPATANTVAKTVCGISDTLVTNAIAQAEKGGVPVVIVPTDYRRGEVKAKLPCHVDRNLCELCKGCEVIELCPTGAIKLADALPEIDLSACEGCGVCVVRCPKGAISFGKEVTVRVRRVDAENVRRLQGNRNFIVLAEPGKIQAVLEKRLVGKGGGR